ncbi:MAG: sulfurtransferase TusA family protein [Candidatus Lokiarchaeota archaeon]|nr:sulfurtransferase TusA family protein [Candidatus Lokiarchaeota archaeon]MBD3198868.1 sulfurtransferase TusA family protein [Candidatus Lokiarchaeota archaeon]
MTEYKLDIVGKVCPYCLLAVRKKVKGMVSGDVLTVMTDHPPAANDTIPTDMKKKGYNVKSTLLEPGVWELTISIS